MTQVAQRLKMSKSDYQRIEGGEILPSPYCFKVLVKYLDLDLVTCRVLLGEEFERRKNNGSSE